MWDSAKKPIKIRSIFRPDGTKHYLLGENDYEEREIINLKKKARQKTRKVQQRKVSLSNSQNSLLPSAKCTEKSDSNDNDSTKSQEINVNGCLKINGNKCHNKDYEKQLLKQSLMNLCQVQPSTRMSRNNTELEIGLDYTFPVPEQQRLGSLGKARSLSPTGTHPNPKSRRESECPENELCSRILNWIDLEVRRNGVRNLTSITKPNLKELKAFGTSLSSSSNSVFNVHKHNSSDSEPIVSENTIEIKNHRRQSSSNTLTSLEITTNKKQAKVHPDDQSISKKSKEKKSPSRKSCQINLTLNQTMKNEKQDDGCSNLWGEIKLKNSIVYLMGETKSRTTCKILLPEETNIKQKQPNNNNKEVNQFEDLGIDSIVNSCTTANKPQLHIFLPLTNGNCS